jgi:hypothetical protein
MKVLNKEETVLLKNGNYNPTNESIQGTKVVKIKCWLGDIDSLVNVSESEIFLKAGYRTMANGYCDDLVLPPGYGIFLSSQGDDYYFSCYRVFKLD